MRRYATIRKCDKEDIDPDRPSDEQKYCLYAKSSGKLLGRHSTIDEAEQQEAAIHARGGSTNVVGQREVQALKDRLAEILQDAWDHLKDVDLPEPIVDVYIDQHISGEIVGNLRNEAAYAEGDIRIDYYRGDKLVGEHVDVALEAEVVDGKGIVTLHVGPVHLVDSYEFDKYDLEHYQDLADFFRHAFPTEEYEPVGHTIVRLIPEAFAREMKREGNTKMQKYIRLAEVPESAVKSLYQDQWGQNLMKAIGDEVNIDSKAAQFLFFTAWNGVIQLMDKMLQEKQDVDTSEYSKDPSFMQALAGLAYFVTDDALKSAMGVKSDSLGKAEGHVEALMQIIGKEAPVDKTLEGLKAQAKPVAEKAFDALMDWLKSNPAKEEKAARVAKVADKAEARRELVKAAFTAAAGTPNTLASVDTKVAPKTARTRVAFDDDEWSDERITGGWVKVKSAIKPYIEQELERYDNWLYSKAGSHYARDFASYVDDWAHDIATNVAWAEESGTGDVTAIDFRDYARNIAKILFKLAPDWELESTDKGEMDIYYDLKEIEDRAIEMAFEATVGTPNTLASVDTKIKKWARRKAGTTGHSAIWIKDIVDADAKPEKWVTAAEQEGLYIPASMVNTPYVNEYLAEEMNDILAKDLKEQSRFGSVGKFVFGEGTDYNKGKWGLWFVTPAVEDVIAMIAPEEKKQRPTKKEKTTHGNRSDEYIRYAGHIYRPADDDLDDMDEDVDDFRDRDAEKVSDKVVEFFKGLGKKASVRSKWARTAKRKRTCCGPAKRSRKSGNKVELPTDCVEQLVGARYSDSDTTTFEKKDDTWFVEGVDSQGVIDDMFVQMAQSTCEMATTAATKRRAYMFEDDFADDPIEHEFDVPFNCLLLFYGVTLDEYRDTDDIYPATDETFLATDDALVTLYKKRGEWHASVPGSTGDDDYMFAPRNDQEAKELEQECSYGRQAATKHVADSIDRDEAEFILGTRNLAKWFADRIDPGANVSPNDDPEALASSALHMFEDEFSDELYEHGFDLVDALTIAAQDYLDKYVRQAATKHVADYTEFEVPFDCLVSFYGVSPDEYPSTDDTPVTIYKEDGAWHANIPGSTGDDDYEFAPGNDQQAQELKQECSYGRQAATKHVADQMNLPGAYEEVLQYDPNYRGIGKFDNNVDEWIYEIGMEGGEEDSISVGEGAGYYELHLFPGTVLVEEPQGSDWTFQAAILFIRSDGIVEVEYFDTVADAVNLWEEIQDELVVEEDDLEGIY